MDELTSLIENACAPIIRVDTNLKIEWWNAHTEKLTGYSKDEALGQNLVEKFIDETSQADVTKVLTRAFELGENSENYELTLFTKDGQKLTILLSATAVRGPGGSVCAVVGVGQDLTRLNAATAAELASKAELEGLIETACAPIIRVDTDLKVTWWNQHTVTLTGFTKEEAIGQNLVEKFIDEDSKASVREVLRGALIDGVNTENYQLPLFTKQGTRRDILLSAT